MILDFICLVYYETNMNVGVQFLDEANKLEILKSSSQFTQLKALLESINAMWKSRCCSVDIFIICRRVNMPSVVLLLLLYPACYSGSTFLLAVGIVIGCRQIICDFSKHDRKFSIYNKIRRKILRHPNWTEDGQHKRFEVVAPLNRYLW